MRYAVVGLLALGTLFGASAQAAPTSPVATQAASSDAVQKVQFYYYGPGWRYRHWGYRPWAYPGWRYRYGYYRPWGPFPGPWYW